MSEVAFITGVTGQDGSYLSELLLSKGYEVHGLVRRSSSFNRERIEHLRGNENFKLHYGDMTDTSNLTRIVKELQPEEIYHLAAQSHVQISFDVPEYTANVDGIGTLRLLEAIRLSDIETRFYNACTSELYGKVHESPQTEETPFHPRSPYGVAKIYSYWIAKNYREAYGMFNANGILFNHESERRGENFVTRKITLSIRNILEKRQERIHLGNLDAKRDWGYAPDYVEAMYLMLQHHKADDFVISSGENHSVREFVECAFREVDIDIEWEGAGVDEKGMNASSREVLVEVSPRYFRPSDVDLLLGDPSKARRELGWEAKTGFEGLVRKMMDAEMSRD